MSFADQPKTTGLHAHWLHHIPRQYGFALIAVTVSALVRFGLDHAFGFSDSFVVFYPAILIAALLTGLGSGLFATLLSMGLAAYFLLGRIDGKWGHVEFRAA